MGRPVTCHGWISYDSSEASKGEFFSDWAGGTVERVDEMTSQTRRTPQKIPSANREGFSGVKNRYTPK